MPDTAVPTNGASTVHDLFALSDEQILEIDAEPQDIEIADVYLDEADRAVLSPTPAEAGQGTSEVRESRASVDSTANAQNPEPAGSHQSPITSHDPAAPPQWLADRMSDPQAGTEARALWDSVQQSRAEAAGFREIFAKPEEARAAAQRARLLDDIDHAYFGGDTTQRASLAASMLREDPAAFREMVFAGLRALEEAAQSSSTRGDVSPRAQQGAPSATAGNSGSSPSPNSQVDEVRPPRLGSRASQAALGSTTSPPGDSAVNRAVATSQASEAAANRGNLSPARSQSRHTARPLVFAPSPPRRDSPRRLDARPRRRPRMAAAADRTKIRSPPATPRLDSRRHLDALLQKTRRTRNEVMK
jgi:hypothetical protein